MGNIIGSLISGFIKVVGNLFAAPLDFLSGKSCSSACGSTWDLLCYIEHFCISKLLRLACVLALFYIVLLFFYLLHKIGICNCICRSMCKMLWACSTSCFSSCEYACMFLWFKMKNLRQRRIDYEDYDSSSIEDDLEERISHRHMPGSMKFRSSLSQRARERRRMHLERSLRPRSQRIRVGISRSSMYVRDRDRRKHGAGHVHVSEIHHNIKVTRTSKFAHKGSASRIQRRRW